MSTTSKSARQKGFSYLLIKGSSVHFRISVPPSLRPIFNCTEFHRSLGTRLLREAKPIAAILGARLGMLFRDTVKRIMKGEIVDSEKLNILVHEMLDSELSSLDRENTVLLQGSTFVERTARRLWLESTAKSIMSSLDSERIVNAGLELIKIACNANDKDAHSINSKIVDTLGNRDISNFHARKDSTIVYPDRWSVEDMFGPVRLERAEREELSSAKMDALEIARGLNTARGVAYKHAALKIDSGNRYSVDAAHEALSKFYPIKENKQKQISQAVNNIVIVEYPKISEAVERYLDNVRLDVRPGTLKNYKLHLSKFVDFYGEDGTLDIVNNESIADFSRYLCGLPTTKSGQTTAASSVITILETVRTFIGKVRKYYKGVIDREFTDDIRDDLNERIRKAKDKLAEEEGIGARVPFTDEDLELIFNKQYFEYWADDEPGRFWIVILLLYTGARLQDIALIQRGDIKITPEMPYQKDEYVEGGIDGIAYIDLTNKKREAALKQKKGKAVSYRVIPIHNFVWNDLGFKDYVSLFPNKTNEHKLEYLFARHVEKAVMEDGSKYAKHNNKLSSDFQKYRVALKIGKLSVDDDVNDKKSLHGLRNTGVAELKKNIANISVAQWHSDLLLGHALNMSMVSSKYDPGFSVDSIYKESIAYLEYHKRIDLAALANSYWTKHKKPKVIRSRGQGKKTVAPWLLDIENHEGPFAITEE